MERLKPLLSSYAGRPLDLLYSRLGGINGSFFSEGWGNLSIVNLREDLELIKQWPPQDMKIDWKLLQSGSWEGTPYKLYEGSFKTPCVRRIYDALPQESRSGRVQLLAPTGPPSWRSAAGGSEQQAAAPSLGPPGSAAVLHLAATGDHGFGRRLRLGGPLLQQGVAQLVHESPYYGARRPPQQRGSKLCAVSDLLALGWATIYESLCLLAWLEGQVGHRAICGLSMGGVHAAMTAGLYPNPLAVAPLLAPRSAAVAYCDGALAPLMAWRSLLTERDMADNEVEAVVAAAAQPVSLLQQARYVTLGDAQQHQQQQAVQAAAVAADEAVAAAQQAAALAAVSQAADAEQQAADEQQQQQQLAASWRSSQAAAADATGELQQSVTVMGGTSQQQQQPSKSSSSSRPLMFAQQQHGMAQRSVSSSSSSRGGTASSTDADSSSWRRQVWRWPRTQQQQQQQQQPAADGGAAPGRLAGLAGGAPPAGTFRRLRQVLETYTDVTRYPPPVRPDAAVLVAARHDGYVNLASVQAMQAHWPGSELRLVDGGHVSAFLLHQEAFRGALRDSLARLAAPPTAQAQQ